MRCWTGPGNGKRTTVGLLGCGTVLLVALAVPAGSENRLNLRATPPISYAPSHVRITADVAPNQDNRRLTIEAESATYFRSSEFALEGAGAPRTHWVEYRQLPAGQYRVSARLEGATGESAFIETAVTVYEDGEAAPFGQSE